MKQKLTQKQNDFIYCLQNGWIIISSDEIPYIICATNKLEFKVSATIFWRCVNKGLIYQENKPPFEYILTKEGKEIKTKKWECDLILK